MKKIILFILIILYPSLSFSFLGNSSKKNSEKTLEKSKTSIKWNVSTETDPIDDSTKTTIILSEKGNSESFLSKNKYLIIRNQHDKFELYVIWEEYISNQSHEVVVRFDKEQFTTSVWNNSSDGIASFCPTPDDFIKMLCKHQVLVVRTRSYSHGDITAIFDIRGLTTIMNKHFKEFLKK